jgi:hypothetical protein
MKLENEIDYDLVERVCHSFGKTLEVVSGTPDHRIIYPSVSYPESLLPYPKSVIKHAIGLWKDYVEKNNRMEDVELMEEIQIQLEKFVPDNEAHEMNQKLLRDEAFLRVMFQKKSGRVS